MRKAPKEDLSGVKPVHRRFLYLDGEEVINSLASLRGGDVTSVLETSLKATGGNAGIKFSLLGAGLNFGGKSSRETRREVQLSQTVHSAVTVLLEQLYEQDGVGRLTNISELGPAAENLVLQFEARIWLEGWVPRSPKVRWNQRLFKSKLEWHAQALAETTDDGLVAKAELDPQVERNRALLGLREKYLLIRNQQEFGRRATVVGKVDMVAARHESLTLDEDTSGYYIRLAQPGSGSTPVATEKSTELEDAEPKARSAAPVVERQSAPTVSNEHVLVRPFCIFR